MPANRPLSVDCCVHHGSGRRPGRRPGRSRKRRSAEKVCLSSAGGPSTVLPVESVAFVGVHGFCKWWSFLNLTKSAFPLCTLGRGCGHRKPSTDARMMTLANTHRPYLQRGTALTKWNGYVGCHRSPTNHHQIHQPPTVTGQRGTIRNPCPKGGGIWILTDGPGQWQACPGKDSG